MSDEVSAGEINCAKCCYLQSIPGEFDELQQVSREGDSLQNDDENGEVCTQHRNTATPQHLKIEKKSFKKIKVPLNRTGSSVIRLCLSVSCGRSLILYFW